MWDRIWKALNILNRIQDRAFYHPVLALVAGLDLFLLLVPTDWLIVSSVLSKPAGWWKTSLWVALGSALGAFCLGYLVLHHRDWVLAHLHLESSHSKLWQRLDFEHLVEIHGLWALAVLGFSILPLQPGVAVAAVGGMDPFRIFIAIFIGRVCKYLIVAWIASHAPKLLVKFHIIPKKHAGDLEILEHQNDVGQDH